MASAISVVVERRSVVESRHRVHAVLVRSGDVAAAAGDPGLEAFMRSAAKPFQALPLAAAAPDLRTEEIAIAAASHEAQPEQLDAVRSLLERAGCTEDDLECGEVDGSRLRHNCSGKHAGMLLLSRLRGWPIADYRLPSHPLQQELLSVVAAAAELVEPEIETGVDGCGVVAYALPLVAMARMFERLAGGELVGADRVASAMRMHPELVGGRDLVDTRLMRAAE